MAGPKGSKYFDVFLNYQIKLSSKTQQGSLNDSLIRLLQEIATEGSLKMAAENRKLSYRKAWGDIKDAELFLGFELIETVRGGKDGGQSRLTKDGEELVMAFEELYDEFDTAIYRITRKFFHQLNQKDGQTPEKSH